VASRSWLSPRKENATRARIVLLLMLDPPEKRKRRGL
jgi:hypothetical protein